MSQRLKWSRFCVGYSVLLLVSLLFFAMATGFFTERLYPRTAYDGERAHYHQTVITQSIRQIGSQFYNETWRYFTKVIDEAQVHASNNPRIGSFAVNFIDGSEMNCHGMCHKENSIRTIQVVITPADPAKVANKMLTLSAHYDGHNAGQAAYDNAINAAMLLEIINAVSVSEMELPMPLVVVLLGSEEFGLHGAWHYLSKAGSVDSHILNFDAIGDGLPFMLVQRTKRNAAVMKTMARVPGLYAMTLGTAVMESGYVASSTDLEVYKRNYTGGEIDFVGNPSHYHTKLDKIRSSRDITILGNQVFYFVMHFRNSDSTASYGLIGISPVSLLLHLTALKVSCLIMLLPVLCFFFAMRWVFRRDAWKRVGAMILDFVLICATVIGLNLLLHVINSVSYADHMVIGVTIELVIGGCTFYFFTSMLWANRIHPLAWQVWFSFITAVFAAAFCFNELGFGGLFATVFSYVPYLLFWKKVKKYTFLFVVFNLVGLVPFIFMFVNVWAFLLKYSSSLRGVFSDAASGVIVFMISYISGLAVLPFAYKHEEEKEAEEQAEPVSKLTWIVAGIVVIVCFAVLSIKSRPFSTEYAIAGWLRQTYDENGISTIAFEPLSSNNIKYLKESITDYPEMQIDAAPLTGKTAIVKRLGVVSLPESFKFPDFKFVESSREGNKRHVQFTITQVPQGMKAVTLSIQCPNNVSCIEDIDGVKDSPVVLPNWSHGLKVRHQPVYDGEMINMTLFSDDTIQVDVLSSFNERSTECDEFFTVFPHYVLATAMGHFENTVLVQSRAI